MIKYYKRKSDNMEIQTAEDENDLLVFQIGKRSSHDRVTMSIFNAVAHLKNDLIKFS